MQGVSLTGSGRAGAAVAQIAGKHLKKVVLELGGSDPFIVLATDDLDAVVEQAVGGRLENTGQACNAAKRFIVVDDLYDAFVEKFTAALTEVEPGDPTSADSAIGPLSSTAAADRLEAQVKETLDAGAKLAAGGGRDGNFFKTAVITDITKDNPGYTEEFFGPVAQVYKVGSEAEAIELANDTPYGLGSYVFTSDSEQALRVADQIDAGMVFINVVGAEGVELPFGGVKASGFGRELGTLRRRRVRQQEAHPRRLTLSRRGGPLGSPRLCWPLRRRPSEEPAPPVRPGAAGSLEPSSGGAAIRPASGDACWAPPSMRVERAEAREGALRGVGPQGVP